MLFNTEGRPPPVGYAARGARLHRIPEQNFVPEPLDFGYECELGSHALWFTLRDNDGYVVTEMVAMRDGGIFDLLGSACW